MNIPNDPDKPEIPDNARGNPVYEQTRQDMPLWCCGRNCGRNTRIVVFLLALIGITCSIIACLHVDYFSFISLRNDTFYDSAKYQPDPFRYAKEADVGLFHYRVVEFFEFPWPPTNERVLFEDLLLEELRRLQNDVDGENNATDTETDVDEEGNNGGNSTDVDGDDLSTVAPNSTDPVTFPEPGPGSALETLGPTPMASSPPTITNPNDAVTDTGILEDVVYEYEKGFEQFDDSMFKNAQWGAVLAPGFALIGIFFGMIEMCCCIYKCSWLPTAVFMYAAFMFQLMTLFLFMSEDFCDYTHDCALGLAGYLSVAAVLCYMFAQSLVCCSPRPTPCFNLCKKPPVRRKKKKKRNPEDDGDDDEYLNGDYDNNSFRDEPDDAYVDPYAEESDDEEDDDYDYDSYRGDSYTHDEDTFAGESALGGDNSTAVYTEGEDDDGDTYGDGTYTEGDATSYYTEDDTQTDNWSANDKGGRYA